MAKTLMVVLSMNLALSPGCNSENPGSTSNVAPEIPPIGTMTADISLFADSHSLQKTGHGQGNNFLQAAVRVGIVNVFLLVGSAVPVAATAAAFSVEPVLREDGKFHWNYSNANLQVDLELIGQVNPGTVNWEMLVTRENPTPLEQFRWYEGENQIGALSGNWTFYDHTQPADDVPVVRVDWNYASEDDKELTFTNIRPGDAKNGSWINYTVTGADVTLKYYDSQEDNLVEISWNRTTGAGYLIDPAYENGAKSCWDENRQNVVCS
jgi:hypothetical protein